MCVHIIQRYDDTMKERGAEGEDRKGQIYTKSTGLAPSCLRVLLLRQHALLYMYVHIYPHTCLRISIYMHINLCPHICIYKRIHKLMHTHTLIHARAYAHGCARARMQDAYERACTGTPSP